MPALAPPRRSVQLDGGPTTLWVLELRALHVNKTAYSNIHRALDGFLRRRMAIHEYKLISFETGGRHEVVVLAVVQRKTAVSRADNVF